MSDNRLIVYIARHGETGWSLSGRHTGLTDIQLKERGQRNARRLGERLKGGTFAKVFTSPLQRASCTCRLAGFGAVAEIDNDLVEWNYGRYEASERLRSLRNVRVGNFSATDVPVGNRRIRWVREQTAS